MQCHRLLHLQGAGEVDCTWRYFKVQQLPYYTATVWWAKSTHTDITHLLIQQKVIVHAGRFR